ncbi:MAG: protein-disulfide reductase DsbD family protein [Alphaproteobacteria bacterium]|nr:protein-disulfide reductase DsbD family protein [Alphaproteobacteria bacterium]
MFLKFLSDFLPVLGRSRWAAWLRPALAAVIFGLCAVSGAPGAHAKASPWVENDHAAVRLISPATGSGVGDSVHLGLQFRLKPGWKIYWRSPGDAGVPPTVDWTGSRNLEGVEVSWPLPEQFTIFGLTTMVYGGEVVLPMEAMLKEPGGALGLRALVRYLVCEKICIPYEARLRLDLEAGPGIGDFGHGVAIARFSGLVPRRLGVADAASAPLAVTGARLFKGQKGLTLEVLARARQGFTAPRLLVEGPRPLRFGAGSAEFSSDRKIALFRLPIGLAGQGSVAPADPLLTFTLADGMGAVEQTLRPDVDASGGTPGLGLIAILGLALLGGLILNLMPCVLPVLSMKVLSVVGHGGGETKLVRQGFLATAAGIVFSFLVLALGAIILKTAGAAVGWGIQFQTVGFLTFMAALLVLFAANLMGLFDISLPGFAGPAAAIGGSKTLSGAFITGAFATLLATPCSAPFLGTAVGFALSRGATEILAVFSALGLGLAAPYLVVAAWPQIATGLPRPGPWMIVLRRILGGALLLTALWLLTVLWALVGATATVLTALLLAGVLAALCLRLKVHRLRAAGLGLAAVFLISVLVLPAVLDGPKARGTGGGGVDAGIRWQPFDHVRLLNHVARGKVVFVDVTADWCLTCKANKALVIDRGEVAKHLRSGDIIAMRADWTRPDAGISAYLRGFGRYGIPFNAVYGPGAPSGIVLSEILTEDSVLAAFSAARPKAAAEKQ